MSENISNQGNAQKSLKITFDDKIDAWPIVQHEAYADHILTATDINDIKHVVNNISDEIQGLDHFSSIYRYVRFILPSILDEEAEYDFTIEMSSDPEFSSDENMNSMDLSENAAKFMKFSNGVWQDMPGKITANDAGLAIRVDIENLLSGIHNAYFGRYKLSNANSSGDATKWRGFTLGAFDNQYINSNKDMLSINNCVINGPTVVVEKTIGTFSVSGVQNDGTLIDLTSHSTFNVIGEETDAIIDSNYPNISRIQFGKAHNDRIAIVKAVTTYNGTTYHSSMQTLIKAVKLEKLDVKFANGTQQMIGNTTVSFTADAIYSDGSVRTNIQNSCTAELDMTGGALNSNEVSCSSKFDEIGRLTLRLNDSDFADLETATAVRYIKYIANDIVAISTTMPTTIDYDAVQGDSYQAQFAIIGTRRNGSTFNMGLNDVHPVIFKPGIISINENNGLWTLSASKADLANSNKNTAITVFFQDETQKTFCASNVKIIGKTMDDVIATFKKNGNEIKKAYAGETVDYDVVIRFTDGTTESVVADSVEAMTSNCTINANAKTVTMAEDAEGIVMIKLTKKYRSVFSVRFISLELVKNEPIDMNIGGDFTVDFSGSDAEQIVRSYSVSGIFNTVDVDNPTEIRNITSGVDFELALGDPNDVVIDNSNSSIVFKRIEKAQEIFTFKAKLRSNQKIYECFTVAVKRMN